MAPIASSNTSRRILVDNTRCLLRVQTRSFSSTSRQQRIASGMPATQGRPKQQSQSSRLKSLARRDIPSDLGVLPLTFVKGTGSDLPSLLSSKWRDRLLMEWVYLKQKTMDFASLYVAYRWSNKDPGTGRRIKTPMDLRERNAIAFHMFARLYKAIAAGDRTTIKQIACSGLSQQQNARLDRRRALGLPEESWGFKIRGILTPPPMPWSLQLLVPWKGVKVITDRQTLLPIGGDGGAVRQVILRIRSTQTRNRNDGSPDIVKNHNEYVVLQRFYFDGKPEDWKIWGTVQPSTVEDARSIMRASKSSEATSGSIRSRIRNGLAGQFGV